MGPSLPAASEEFWGLPLRYLLLGNVGKLPLSVNPATSVVEAAGPRELLDQEATPSPRAL